MMKTKMKKLAAIAGLSVIGAGYALAAQGQEGCVPVMECPPPAPVDTCNYGVMFGTRGQETKKFCFSGLIQTDYRFVNVEDPNTYTQAPADTNNMLMRRVRLGFEADLGEGWHGVVVMDFAGAARRDLYGVEASNWPAILAHHAALNPEGTAAGTVTTTHNKHGVFGLYKAYIEKIYGGNSFKAGYRKVNFVREEMVPAGHLKAIERSVVTNYFNESLEQTPNAGSPLGFGERHVGVYVDGMYNNVGYGAAVVNGYQGTRQNSTRHDNEVGFFANLFYSGVFNNIEVEIGFQTGFKPKGNNYTLSSVYNNGVAVSVLPVDSSLSKRGNVWGWNPYIMGSWKGFHFLGEVVGARIQHGAVDAKTDASPFGITVQPSYFITDQFEIVGRVAYLDTDSRGTRLSTIIPGCAEIRDPLPTGVFPAATIFNKVYAWYIGFNYYMMNKSVKLSGGLEYMQTRDRHYTRQVAAPAVAESRLLPDHFSGDKAEVIVGRARVQIVF